MNTRIIKYFSIFFMLFHFSSAWAVFINGGFESGDFDKWTTSFGYNPGLSGKPPFSEGNIVLKKGGMQILKVLGKTSDPRTDNKLPLPGADNKTAKINDEFGSNHVNIITQKDSISESDRGSDGKLHVRFSYAAVLEDPQHPPEAQPYFYVHLRDTVNGQMLYSEFTYSNQPGRSFHTSNSGGTWKWTDWNNIDIVVPESSLGHSIEITASAADCAYGGHGGYVYLDGFGSTAAPTNAVVSSVSPTSATVGDKGGALTVNGSNFLQGDVVQWNGFSRPTTFVSATRLTAVLQDADYSKAGTANVTVARGTASSNAMPVTINPAVPKLTALTASCTPTTVESKKGGTCSANASYDNSSSKSVTPSWTSSDGMLFYVAGDGAFSTTNANKDTPVTVTASYSENGITKTGTATVTVKAAVVTLTGLTASCPSAVPSGEVGFCMAEATFSDGAKKQVNPSWTSSNPTIATMNGNAILAGNIRPDTDVTLTASYTKGSDTHTATAKVTIQSYFDTQTMGSPCTWPLVSQTMMIVEGSSVKKFGDPLEVTYCMGNFDPTLKYDIYLAVQMPDNSMIFLQSDGLFGTPTFGGKLTPYISNMEIMDEYGPVLSIPSLPNALPTGTYTFLALSVPAGADVMNTANWLGQMAQSQVTLVKQ